MIGRGALRRDTHSGLKRNLRNLILLLITHLLHRSSIPSLRLTWLHTLTRRFPHIHTLHWHRPYQDFRIDRPSHSPQVSLAKGFGRLLIFLAFFPLRRSLDLPETQLLSFLLAHTPTLNW